MDLKETKVINLMSRKKRRHELFLNEIIPNIKIPNPKNGENPKCKNPQKELS
jgi:hypothetical protein